MDELEYIKQLAGVNQYSYKGHKEYTIENMSYTANELRKVEKEKGIKPGDPEWFELWFSLPYLTGHTFRGRKSR